VPDSFSSLNHPQGFSKRHRCLFKKDDREGWGVEVAIRPLFLPMGDSTYSYRVETVAGELSYLKVVDRRTGTAQQLVARMRRISLPLPCHVAELELEEMGAPVPQPTRCCSLTHEHGRLLLAVYSYIEGETLSDAYPMSAELVERIGRALGRLHAMQVPEHLRRKPAGLLHPEMHRTEVFCSSRHCLVC
jgi:Ser/Thr protein kinase RdoA (MazF antagonist)